MKSQLVDSNGRANDTDVSLVGPEGQPLSSKEPAPQPLNLVPFDDGYVYKFSDNPARKGTYVMHTVDGAIVAVLPDPRVANLLCEAMRMLFLANQQVKEGEEVPEFAKEEVSEPVVFES